ncbi:hypothetical protein D0439_16375 [Lysinibacillus fusiformis]|uniref:DUF6886 family protein n=2 Tax=Bacillaceae TaxID=186817 RepID=UPI0004D69AF5|nr:MULTISPECIES: DUF6886 family protein [Lysinibacillus]AJK88782.1 hypothetical protein HR49_17425 [Lysinibacillus fusiformis]KGA83013.1 hypothetical protein KQ41_10950 [Lysinibacillus fusiformis]KHK48503.1 hypothetical protein PI85_23120 [Lysinibacillus sp. A1]MCE4043464.1 hypothetical protein [Lysinibacillus fusiformis]QEA00107.1 hypothetical protein D0439_16375 [Lysinibacillus fusiformis]
MRLFHVSEDPTITIFHPRIPERPDLDASKGLVWAINERCLPNYLTPRDCPRVCFHAGSQTTEQDRQQYLTTAPHVVIIERKWVEVLKSTRLYLYEFEGKGFTLQDENAGYSVSETAQIPIALFEIDDIYSAMLERNVELRIVDSLWDIHDEIQHTTLHWSMCRMRCAQPRY